MSVLTIFVLSFGDAIFWRGEILGLLSLTRLNLEVATILFLSIFCTLLSRRKNYYMESLNFSELENNRKNLQISNIFL